MPKIPNDLLQEIVHGGLPTNLEYEMLQRYGSQKLDELFRSVQEDLRLGAYQLSLTTGHKFIPLDTGEMVPISGEFDEKSGSILIDPSMGDYRDTVIHELLHASDSVEGYKQTFTGPVQDAPQYIPTSGHHKNFFGDEFSDNFSQLFNELMRAQRIMENTGSVDERTMAGMPWLSNVRPNSSNYLQYPHGNRMSPDLWNMIHR